MFCTETQRARTLHKLRRAKVIDKSLLCTEFCGQTDCPHMAVNVCGHVTPLYLTAGISAHGMSVKLASSLWICAASTIGHRKEVFLVLEMKIVTLLV